MAKNILTGLSVGDIAIIVFTTGFLSLFVFGLISQFIHSQKALVISHLQAVRNATPQILALAVLLSRLFIHPERILNQIFNDRGFYVTLPVKRNSILRWCLIVTLIKDSLWIVLGIVLTLIIAHEMNLAWLSSYAQTIQLLSFLVVIASLISFVSLIIRIILASRIQFERKFILKLLTFAEILFSLLFLAVILYLRITLTEYFEAHWEVNDVVVRPFFFLAIISLLYLIINKLFSAYENDIKKHFEIENDYYSVRELPKSVQRLVTKHGSPLVRSILRLSLAARSYGFTKFHSLMVIAVQAIVMLIFSVSISDATTSVIVFIISATVVTTSFFFTVLVSAPSVFVLTKPLPLSFKEIARAYHKGGLLLSIPAFALVLLLSVCLGFSNSIKAVSLSLLLCSCIVPLRVFIALRYPYSRFSSDIAFMLSLFCLILSYQLFFLFPIIGLIPIVVYYRKKASHLWNTAGLL